MESDATSINSQVGLMWEADGQEFDGIAFGHLYMAA